MYNNFIFISQLVYLNNYVIYDTYFIVFKAIICFVAFFWLIEQYTYINSDFF